MELVKSKDQEQKDGITGDSSKDSELLGLIEDFHDQYQCLYNLYNHLREESGKKYRVIKDGEGFSSPSSSSDTEYYSPDDRESQSPSWRSERRKELSALVKAHEIHGIQAEAQIKELEGQLSSLRLNLEAQLENKTEEAKQLGKENKGLQARVLELELISKEKGDEIANLLKKLQDKETNLTSKIEELMAKVGFLQQEVDTLRARKGEVEGKALYKKNEAVNQIRGLRDQVNAMHHDLACIKSQKNELERLLEGKNKEVKEKTMQVGSLKEEMGKKTKTEKRMQKERESFLVKVKDLESELESARNQNKKLEEQVDGKKHDLNLLKEENEKLLARISETKKPFKETADELHSLQKKYKNQESESSKKVRPLKAQIDDLHQELDYLQAQNSQLESQIVGERQKYTQNLNQMDQQKVKLTTKIADQQRVIKEHENTISKLTNESKQVQRQKMGSKASLQIAEKKMSELAEEYRRNLEDNIRVLHQRIRVAEQLHNENKDIYRLTKERLQEKTKLLDEKIATHEAGFKKAREILEPGNYALSVMESALRKMDNADLVNRISNISDEVVFAKSWVAETRNDVKGLNEKVDSLVAQLDDKEEQEFLLRDKVWKLEAKLGKQGGEKLNLTKSVSQLELKVGELEKKIKEKDEDLINLGEEKREAIRQLCLLIEYHRSHCDHLKKAISKMMGKKNKQNK